MASNPHEPLTRKVLEEVIDERVPKIIDERLPLLLGQFTDEVLLPAVERIVHDEIAASEHRLKVWVDEKLVDLRGDLVLLTRKEDRKVLRLVDFLRQNHALTDAQAKEIMGTEPFAIT